MISRLLGKSTLPEMSDTSWDLVVSILSSSDGLLDPDSEDSVVCWLSLDDALNNLVQPLVSGGAWSSTDNLDEVVNHVLEGWFGSWEVLSCPSDSSSLGVLCEPSLHIVEGEGVSDCLLTVWCRFWFWSEIWVDWFLFRARFWWRWHWSEWSRWYYDWFWCRFWFWCWLW